MLPDDPLTGEELWTADASTNATCGTIVWDEQCVYASGGYPDRITECVRADGSGEVVWEKREKCYEQSLLVHEGHVYAVTDAGVAYCWQATDGEERWSQRLGGKFSSSPLLVNDRIYVFSEDGIGFVFRATPEKFDLLHEGKVADEIFATPIVSGDTMFLRIANHEANGRQEYLLSIG